MQSYRRMNDFDKFFQQTIKCNAEPRSIQSQLNQNIRMIPSLNVHNKENKLIEFNNRSRSPTSMKSTKKPLIQHNITPQRQQISDHYATQQINYSGLSSSKKTTCSNHLNKNAQFSIVMDEEQFLYCQKCATHLSSQGFLVHKINNNYHYTQNINNQNNCNTIKNNYHKDYMNKTKDKKQQLYNQLIQFIQWTQIIEIDHKQQIKKYKQLDQQYKYNIQIINNFYKILVQKLNKNYKQHIKYLQKQKQINQQKIKQKIEILLQNIQQIIQIRLDIQNNLESIINQIKQDKFKQCMNQYQIKIKLFQKQVYNKINKNYYFTIQEVNRVKNDILKAIDNTNYLFNTKQSLSSKRNNKWQSIKDIRQQEHQSLLLKDYRSGPVKEDSQRQMKPEKKISIKSMHKMLLPQSSVESIDNSACRSLFQPQVGFVANEVISPEFKHI